MDAATLTEPPVLVSTVGALIYWQGTRMPVRVVSARDRLRRQQRRRSAAFAAGLVTVVVSLVGPMDDLSDRWFWVHMGQHLLLTMVAAPLLVLGAPWLAPWRLLRQRTRTRLTRLAEKRALGGLRHGIVWLSQPIPAWVGFNLNLVVWHVPALYNLTLHNSGVHYTEHVLLLTTGMLFWAQLLESPPLRRHLSAPQTVAYLTTASVVGWLLALFLALAGQPLYSAYAVQDAGRGGMSALTDQQLAAGMMWVPGSISYTIGVFAALYVWLGESAGAVRHVRRPPNRLRRHRHAMVP